MSNMSRRIKSPHLPELCPNGASQHVLVDIMNNAALPLQLMEKDSMASPHGPTFTPTCQRGKRVKLTEGQCLSHSFTIQYR